MFRFQAFKCGPKSLKGAQFFRHEDCNINRGHLKEKEYYVVGDNSKYTTTGARCVMKETVRTGYCGKIIKKLKMNTNRILRSCICG